MAIEGKLTLEEEYSYKPDYFDDPDNKPDFYGCSNKQWREFKRTDEVPSPDVENVFDMVIGQDRAKRIMQCVIDSVVAGKKAYCLFIGPPGTGKSLLARGAAQEIGRLMPEYTPPEDFDMKEFLKKYYPKNEVRTYDGIIKCHKRVMKDFVLYEQIVLPNKRIPNKPHVRLVPAGTAEDYVAECESKEETNELLKSKLMSSFIWSVAVSAIFALLSAINQLGIWMGLTIGISFATLLIVPFFLRFLAGGGGIAGQGETKTDVARKKAPLLLQLNSDLTVPYVDASGGDEQELFGMIDHNPLGFMGEPPHRRVKAGAIHRASGGILFIDEVDSISLNQQMVSILKTVMQENFMPIRYIGRTVGGEHGVVTEPAACKVSIVAGGNDDALHKIHPAIRSRFYGEGWETYTKVSMENTPHNKRFIFGFIHNEQYLWDRLPFTRAAGIAIVEESLEWGGGNNITLRLRDLGGIVMAASRYARAEQGKDGLVQLHHIERAIEEHRTVEEDKAHLEKDKRERKSNVLVRGSIEGRVNGLVVRQFPNGRLMGGVAPIVCAQTKGRLGVGEGPDIVKLGALAASSQEGMEVARALILRYHREDIPDILAIRESTLWSTHAQSYHIMNPETGEEGPGVAGRSATVDYVVALFSIVWGVPAKQNCAMTGSVDVGGMIEAIGGAHAKIRAAEEKGIRLALIPYTNLEDVDIGRYEIKVVPCKYLWEYLDNALDWEGSGKDKELYLKKMKEDASVLEELIEWGSE